MRVEAARHLLEAGSAAVDDVGFTVGYEDPTFFRRLFRRATGMSPAAYRRKYAAIVPVTPPAPTEVVVAVAPIANG